MPFPGPAFLQYGVPRPERALLPRERVRSHAEKIGLGLYGAARPQYFSLKSLRLDIDQSSINQERCAKWVRSIILLLSDLLAGM